MKCNLIVPGFAKSGTSSLHKYLDMHPRICMSSVKEPHFFFFENRFKKGPHNHDHLFSHASQNDLWFGESSTSYAVWEPALLRIRKCLITPRIILLLRNPVERLLSHYRWMFALGLETKGIKEALIRERKSPVLPEVSLKGCYPWYRRHSNYSYFCELMFAMFGEESVLLLSSDDLKLDPQYALNRCFSFLGLDSIEIIQDVVENQTSEKTIQRTFGFGVLLKSIPIFWREQLDSERRLRNTVKKVFGRVRRVAPSPTKADMGYIEELLAEDIEYYRKLFSVGDLQGEK